MTLQRAFDRYNQMYFGGKLKISGIAFKTMRRGHAETIFLDKSDPAIIIGKHLKNFGRLLRIALLHEMAHCALKPRALHGPEFMKQIKRLMRLGAYNDLL